MRWYLKGGSFALFLERTSLNGRPAVARFDQIQGPRVNSDIVLRAGEVLVAPTLSSGFSLTPFSLFFVDGLLRKRQKHGTISFMVRSRDSS